MIALTITISFTDKVPLHVNLAVFSIAIIVIGSYRSLYEMVAEIKKVQLTGKNEESSIETVSAKDAMQFPLVAGGTLLGLYILIKIFGKESVNYFILVYIAIGGTTGIKALV
jgi:minor histocompatibility antigen H13